VITIVNPATEEVIGRRASASTGDVIGAASRANAQLQGWRDTDPGERAAMLTRVADRLVERADAIAQLITAELGAPAATCRALHVNSAIEALRQSASGIAAIRWRETVGRAEVRRVGIGAVGSISPWNYPLYQCAVKIGGAIAAGCPVVLKPSEIAASSIDELLSAFAAAGAPAGLLQIVHGDGLVGAELCKAPGLAAISFTGSTVTGARVAAAAGAELKKVGLELGGKSASVLLDDGDVEKASRSTLAKAFQNSGQTCAALTRFLVPRARLSQVEEALSAEAQSWITGDPRDPATRLGPVATGRQFDVVTGYIDEGVADDLRVIAGGSGRPAGLNRGFYVKPTVFSDVSPNHRLAQEEIFGPVLAVIAYGDEDEAVRIANGTQFALSGAVWSRSTDRAAAFAELLDAGSISLNGASTDPAAPFGGFRGSGYGRERGRYGIEEYLTERAVHPQ
jgi:acyl-CoA reductase-like NAD-dependent aldehyde dehydrogenase